MPRPIVHRSLTKDEKNRVLRIMVRRLPEVGRATVDSVHDEICTLLDRMIQVKYDKGYHSGYTTGQRNPERESE